LKRVKISVSSPGEIRLSNDLEHLTHQCGWSKNLHHHDASWYACYQHQGTTLVLTRDSVDLLRLKLVVELTQQKECTFYMQFPRMYPHSAPEIYRLSPSSQTMYDDDDDDDDDADATTSISPIVTDNNNNNNNNNNFRICHYKD
jgi:hypothetical protein